MRGWPERGDIPPTVPTEAAAVRLVVALLRGARPVLLITSSSSRHRALSRPPESPTPLRTAHRLRAGLNPEFEDFCRDTDGPATDDPPTPAQQRLEIKALFQKLEHFGLVTDQVGASHA